MLYETWLEVNKKDDKECDVESITRIGKCPICKARVETSYTDIFFPYCGYTCKRVMQKKEEEREKRKIENEQKRYEAKLLADRKRTYKKKEKKTKKSEIEMVRARLEKCKAEYENHSKAFDAFPTGSRQRHNEWDRANYWYKQMLLAQKAADNIENREAEK